MHRRPGDLAVSDGLRLALGTLTVLPVPAPRRVDRTVGGAAMAWAPLAGLLLALPLVVVAWLGTAAGLAPLLVAVLVLAGVALLTRGLHLDGLADTADGLGSGRDAAGALEVMRRGDVGPFGVVTLVLVLLVQTAALGQLVAGGRGALAVVLALVVSRLVLPVACRTGVPAARPEGLGAVVAGTVGAGRLLTSVLASYLLLALVVAAGASLATDAALIDAAVTGVATAAVALVGLASRGAAGTSLRPPAGRRHRRRARRGGRGDPRRDAGAAVPDQSVSRLRPRARRG